MKDTNQKKRLFRNIDAINADVDLMACPECGVVWEIITINQTAQYKYYQNFPRFGKKKSICYGCAVRIKNKYYYNKKVKDPL